MTGYLLDTNVISELTRDIPDPRVIDFLAERDDVWVSSILIHEVEYGVRLLPQGTRRNRLSTMQAAILSGTPITYCHWTGQGPSGPPSFGQTPGALDTRSTWATPWLPG